MTSPNNKNTASDTCELPQTKNNSSRVQTTMMDCVNMDNVTRKSHYDWPVTKKRKTLGSLKQADPRAALTSSQPVSTNNDKKSIYPPPKSVRRGSSYK
jgi:hypothetical protein